MATRILYVITKANWGGAQRYVYDLATAAKEAGHEVAVAVGGEGFLSEKLRAAGIRVIPFGLRQRRTFIGDLLTFAPLLSLVRIFRAEHPAVVHVNSAKAGGLGALAARIVGVPRIVFTAHGWEFNAPRAWLSKAGIRLFSWLTVLLSHRTICVSDAVRRDIAWMPGVSRKLAVVHNGIACEPLLARAEARRALDSEMTASYWIGMISELHPTKRVDDAIRAFALVLRRHPDTALFVMGEGAERARLERLIRDLHVEERVRLLGHIDGAPRYLSAFDLFIHTSQSEALAFSVLEAGCAGLPAIATRVGGIPEIIEDGVSGILVPPRDTPALVRAIEMLYSNAEKSRALAMALAARIRGAFTKERMLADTLAQYR